MYSLSICKKRQPVQIWLSFYFDYVIRFDNKKSPEIQDFLEATTRFEGVHDLKNIGNGGFSRPHVASTYILHTVYIHMCTYDSHYYLTGIYVTTSRSVLQAFILSAYLSLQSSQMSQSNPLLFPHV